MKETVKLQPILIDTGVVWGETRPMYYRGERNITRRPGREGYFLAAGVYDFSTYFNNCSIAKWQHYTIAEHFTLELEAEGEFALELVGRFVDVKNKVHLIHLGNFSYKLKSRERISLPIPSDTECIVAGFVFRAVSDCVIYDGGYYAEAETEEQRDVRVTLATTTFKKERYVRKNWELLHKGVFADPELADHFCWKIVDNGSTLNPAEFNDEYVEVIPNRNVGGSGGFCRGMLAAIDQQVRPTHVLLMDDDVEFLPESFRRVYMLLRLLKTEFDDHFISGAMLEIHQRNIQHEDVGLFRPNGAHGPAKPRYNLSKKGNPVRNEVLLPEDPHQYMGWWYCCIPMQFVREDNLPLPFFIRGDDVEYSIRNHAKFITMNGICIWHEGFSTKFSASLELYQVHRNDLILRTMNEHISDIDVITRMKNLFWEEMFKFNYKGCELILDAVEDFLKGPEYLQTLNGETCMKEKKAKDNVLVPVTEEVSAMVDEDELFEFEWLTGLKLKLYGHFVNGHRLPEFLCGRKTAVIPYGWGYSQKQLFQSGTVYAVDPYNETYVIFRRDRAQYRALRARFNEIMGRYNAEYETVAAAYRAEASKMTGRAFWEEYLR